MPTAIHKSFDEQVLDGLVAWRKSHPDELQWDNLNIADWLMDHEKYDLGKRIVRRELAKRLAKVQNRKRVRNGNHKLVREYHAAKFPVSVGGKLKQKTFWAHRTDMTASFAHASFEQRQKQAEGFCRSMSNDAKDVNEFNPQLRGTPVQLELDFRYVDRQAARQQVQTIPDDYTAKLSKKRPR